MTGPDHFRRAELWLALADSATGERALVAAAAAQAHATLALTAATVHLSQDGIDGTGRLWDEALS